MPSNGELLALALASVCSDVAYGYTESATTEPVGPRFLRITDIQGGRFDWSSVPYCAASAEAAKKYALQIGDIVVARTGNSTGENAQVWTLAGPAVFASYLIRFRVDPRKANPFFVGYQLRTQRFRDYVRAVRGGSAQPGANAKQLGGFELLLPERSHQDDAVGVLREIDQRISLLRQTNATLESIAQALFKSWFIDFDPVRAKAEGREPEGMDAATAARFPAEFEESAMGLIPKGWGITKLGDYLELTKGCSYKGEGLSEADGAYMFNLGCFNAHRVFANEKVKRYTGEYRPRHAVVPGDLIVANTDMTQARDILGRPAFVPDGFEPGFISHHVFKVTMKTSDPDLASALRLFLFFALQQDAFRERAIGYAVGTTVLALPANAVTECQSCVPPDKALRAFADAVRHLLERVRLNEKHVGTLVEIRDELLPRLISGKLRIPEARTQLEEAIA